jgi:hypothetical protein
MANNLKFTLGADVSEALKGMTAVEQRSIVLQKQIEYLQQVIGNTSSVKTFNTSIDALARKQSELSKITAKAGDAFKGIKPGANEATQSLTNLSRIAQDAPFGFIGISNNINPLLESFQRLKASTGSTGGALKALAGSLTGAGGLGLAVGVGTALLTVFGDKLFSTKKKAEETEDSAKKLKDSLNGVFSGVAKEAASVTSLVAVLSSETETRQRKLAAIKELQEIQPEVFSGLKLEGQEVVGLDNAYKNYLGTLKTTIAAKIKQAQIEQQIEKLLKLEGATLVGLEKSFDDFTKAVQNNQQQQIGGEDDFMGARDKATKTFGKQEKDRQNQIKATTAEIERLTGDLKALSTGIEVDPLKTPNLKDKTNEIIAEGKRLAKELANIGVVVPVFSETQTEKQQLQLAKKLINQFKGAKLEFDVTPVIDETKIDVPQLMGSEATMTQAQKNAEKDGAILGNAFNIGVTKALETGREVSPQNQKIRNLEAANQQIKAQAVALGKSFNQAFATAIQGGFEQIGVGLGNVLSGKDFGQGILQVFSGLLQAIGEALIQYGIVKKGLDAILGPSGFAIPGAAAIGLGVLAIASAQLVKNFGGAREKGGPVSGNKTYLVGERGPELFVPSVGGSIVPNNQLGSFGGRPAFAMGGGGGGRSIVRGNDILLASARSQRSISRVNA